MIVVTTVYPLSISMFYSISGLNGISINTVYGARIKGLNGYPNDLLFRAKSLMNRLQTNANDNRKAGGVVTTAESISVGEGAVCSCFIA